MSPAAHRVLVTETERAGERLAVSAISLWEIAKLVERRRLRITRPLEDYLADVEGNAALEVPPLTARIAVESTRVLPTADDPIRASGVVPVG